MRTTRNSSSVVFISNRWWVTAILIRLFLMPLFFHGDQIFIQHFPWYASYQGHWDVYGYLQNTFLDKGFTYYPPLVLWMTSLWQLICQPLMSGFDGWMRQADSLIRLGTSSAITDFTAGNKISDILRWIFMTKLLYLIADVACWRLIRVMVRRDPSLSRLEILWIFHPVLLFSTYIFGQYRILTALIVWAAAALFQRDRKDLGMLLFGCLLLLDNYACLILVPTILIWGQGTRERFGLFLTSIAVPVIVLIPWIVVSHGYVLTCYVSPTVQRMSMQGIFRSLTPEAAIALKALFVLIWTVTLGLAWKIHDVSTKKRLVLWSAACAAVLLALYATSTAMIHYFMWILPFWILLRTQCAPSFGWPATVIPILLFLFNLDSRGLNLGLMAHLDPGLLSAPSFHEVMDRWLPWGKVVALARLAFTVLCLYFVFVCHRILFEHRNKKLSSQ